MNLLQLATQLIGFAAVGRIDRAGPAAVAQIRPAPGDIHNAEGALAMRVSAAQRRDISRALSMGLLERIEAAHGDVDRALSHSARMKAAGAEERAALARAHQAAYRTGLREAPHRAAGDLH